jgi:hypothetical protein
MFAGLRSRCRTWLWFFQPGREAASLHELHGEERHALVFAEFEDLHDMRMLQARDGLTLGAETSSLLAGGMTAGREHLQGDDTTERLLPGLVNDPHAPAELSEDFIASHFLGQGTRHLVGIAVGRAGAGAGRANVGLGERGFPGRRQRNRTCHCFKPGTAGCIRRRWLQFAQAPNQGVTIPRRVQAFEHGEAVGTCRQVSCDRLDAVLGQLTTVVRLEQRTIRAR